MNIDIQSLQKYFGEHHVLRDIDLSIDNAHSLVIVGPSGGGKTTLLRILAGLEEPTSGSVAVNGTELTRDERQLREYRKRVGMVFQSYNLFPHLTALENIVLPLVEVHRYERRDAEERARDLLARFRLSEHEHKKPSQLSGGQNQRIALSRAMAIQPDFLLLDEPTSALDPEFTADVLDMIEELREEDIHLMLVTHEMGFARHVADHILFVADGRIVEQGPPEEVLERPREESVRRFLDRILRY